MLYSYKVSADTVHLVFTPIRLYYRLTRFLFGEDYKPFKEVKEGLHPIPGFYKRHQATLRFLFYLFRYMVIGVLTLTIHFILRRIYNLLAQDKQSIIQTLLNKKMV